jgi:hypothetical protein
MELALGYMYIGVGSMLKDVNTRQLSNCKPKWVYIGADTILGIYLAHLS